MQARHQSRSQTRLLFAILFLAATLRLIGITWGVPSPDYPHHPFHPDEAWAMGVLEGANPSTGDFVIEKAHREGSLLYYLLTANSVLLKKAGAITETPCCFTKDPESYRVALQDYRRVLLSGRALVAAMDVAAVLLVFLIVRRLTDGSAALAAAGLYAIVPFEVVHAHFMRTHTPSNLMILLVLYASTWLPGSNSKRLIILLGLLSGLASAMRFTTVVVILVPACMILAKGFEKRGPGESLTRRWSGVLAGGMLLGISALVGLFLGDPPLFLNFGEVQPFMAKQMQYAILEEFSFSNILNLERVGVYLTDLIPHATGTWLSLLFWLAMLYSLLLRRYYAYTIPWILMNAVYLYSMAKGYAEPIFARAALNLLPVFALVTGIAIHDAFQRLQRFPKARRTLVALLVAVTGWTLVLDGAYLRAMTGSRDPRYQVRQYLFSDGQARDLSIGLYADDTSAYFTAHPAFFPKHGGSTRFLIRQDFSAATVEQVDYLALTGYHRNYELTDERIDQLTESGRFVLDKEAVSDFSFLGISFEYRQLPADMQYPLFEIYLLRPSRSDIGRSVGPNPNEPIAKTSGAS